MQANAFARTNIRFKQGEDVSYQSRDGEVSSMHLFSQPVDFSPGVEEDHSLCDCQSLIQITESVQLPLLETNARL